MLDQRGGRPDDPRSWAGQADRPGVGRRRLRDGVEVAVRGRDGYSAAPSVSAAAAAPSGAAKRKTLFDAIAGPPD